VSNAAGAARVQHGVYTPTFGEFDERALAALAARAEATGWDGFFVWDHVLWDPFESGVADATVSLTAIALATSRIRFGALVSPLARRRPWKFARESVTLDRLSGGRLVVGVGGGVDEDFIPVGEAAEARERADRLDEALEVLTRLWTGETVTYEGRYHHLADAVLRPSAVQRPRPPVWVGGWWPNRRPFVRGSRWDGIFPLNREQPEQPLPPDRLRECVQFVARLRDGAPFDVAVSLHGQDPAPYAEAGATWCLYGVDPWIDSLADARDRVEHGPPR
jgi:alkanesulfonate monooxygenase SsuD/methylene tetrahydromethanopterin reductase-like flavin-dependent oxidoreductase (luciferase family)